jgi:hypothetical protein
MLTLLKLRLESLCLRQAYANANESIKSCHKSTRINLGANLDDSQRCE